MTGRKAGSARLNAFYIIVIDANNCNAKHTKNSIDMNQRENTFPPDWRGEGEGVAFCVRISLSVSSFQARPMADFLPLSTSPFLDFLLFTFGSAAYLPTACKCVCLSAYVSARSLPTPPPSSTRANGPQTASPKTPAFLPPCGPLRSSRKSFPGNFKFYVLRLRKK